MGKSKKYYAVARGAQPGIYTAWFGPQGAEEQIRGVPGALYRGFPTLTEAERWLKNPVPLKAPAGKTQGRTLAAASLSSPGKVLIYTDGGCLGNPGPGGYGAIIVEGETEKELSAGYRLTTNNRMELTACIAALASLKAAADVLLHTDSRYVVNGISKGWARRWRANDWMRTKTEAAENSDLWEQLLDLCTLHRVEFVWVRGHAGHPENERCDELATAAARGADLQEDHAYVRGRARMPSGLFRETG
jgi:ribonuclease HI